MSLRESLQVTSRFPRSRNCDVPNAGDQNGSVGIFLDLPRCSLSAAYDRRGAPRMASAHQVSGVQDTSKNESHLLKGPRRRHHFATLQMTERLVCLRFFSQCSPGYRWPACFFQQSKAQGRAGFHWPPGDINGAVPALVARKPTSIRSARPSFGASGGQCFFADLTILQSKSEHAN